MRLECFLVHTVSFAKVSKSPLASYIFDVLSNVADNIKRKIHREAITMS
jgi:hypothetical protein